MSIAYKRTKRLAREHPNWLPVLEAALKCAMEYGEFSGSSVLQEAKKKRIEWIPGLRMLVRYGILRHEDTTRGGRKAYYTIPDQGGVKKALHELKTGIRTER